MRDILYCPVCGEVLIRQELGDTVIYYCEFQQKHRAGTMVYDED